MSSIDNGAALRILGQACDVLSARMMFLGDSHNDISMLEVVMCSHVVKNTSTACNGMQRHVRFLAESNDGYSVLQVQDEIFAR